MGAGRASLVECSWGLSEIGGAQVEGGGGDKGRVLLRMGRSELRKGRPRYKQIRWGNVRRCRSWDLVKRSLSLHV